MAAILPKLPLTHPHRPNQKKNGDTVRVSSNGPKRHKSLVHTMFELHPP